MSSIIIDNLHVVTHANIPVITTELLAQLYGAEVNSIQQNFKRNAERFINGKHFFKLEGSELREYKNRLTESQSVAKHTRSLILWTERGAARHAKMLETDQAWEVFEKLEDCYFNQCKQDLFDTNSAITVSIPREGRWLVCYRNRHHQVINIDGNDCVNSDYVRRLRHDIHSLVEILQDFGCRTLVMSGDASPTRLDKPLIEDTDQKIS